MRSLDYDAVHDEEELELESLSEPELNSISSSHRMTSQSSSSSIQFPTATLSSSFFTSNEESSSTMKKVPQSSSSSLFSLPSPTTFSDLNIDTKHSTSSSSHTTSLPNEGLQKLWESILQNRSENNDIDGCLEIMNILRESSIPRNVLQWERTFSAAISSKSKKLRSQSLLSRSHSSPDLLLLLKQMKNEDNVIPSHEIFKYCLIYYSSKDETNNVIEIIKIMQSYDITINQEVLRNIEDMRTFDMILEYLDSL